MFYIVLQNGEPNAERKACYDCKHMKGAGTLWCTNTEAKEHRGTVFAGAKDCKFWEPCKTLEQVKAEFNSLPWYSRIFATYEDDYMVLKNQKTFDWENE